VTTTPVPVTLPAGGGASGFFDQCGAQGVDAIAADAGNRKDRCAGQWPGGQQVFDLLFNFGDALLLDAVDLGQRYQRATDAEQLDDGQVFAGLRHDAIVSGDHQQHAVDAAGAGQHVVYETLVARHVDKAGEAAFTEVGVDVAEVDGDAAFALFAAAVALLPGEGLQ